MRAQTRAEKREILRAQWRERKAAELRARGEEVAALEVLAGRCACGCGNVLAASSVRTFYVDQKHRARRHRRRLERLAEAAGVPARLNLDTVQTSTHSGGRARNASARSRRHETRPRPGVTVYFPTVEMAEALLIGDLDEMNAAHERVRAAIERRERRG